jgi:hypothetical protein
MHLLGSAHGGFAQHHEFVGGSDFIGQHNVLLGFNGNNLTRMPNILVLNGVLHQRSRRVSGVQYRLLVRPIQPKSFLKVQRNNFGRFLLRKQYLEICF